MYLEIAESICQYKRMLRFSSQLKMLRYETRLQKNLCRKLMPITTSISRMPNIVIYGSDQTELDRFSQTLIEQIVPSVKDSIVKESNKSYVAYGKKKTICIKQVSDVVFVTSEDYVYGDSNFLEIILHVLGGKNPSRKLNGSTNFKLLVIRNINGASFSQQSLCRFMDEMRSYVRFLFTSSCLTYLSRGIRSRCVAVRLPAVSVDEQVDIINGYMKKLDDGVVHPMICRKDIRYQHAVSTNLLRILANNDADVPSWRKCIVDLASIILRPDSNIFSESSFREIRRLYYNLLIYGYSTHKILELVTKELISQMDKPLAQILQVLRQSSIHHHLARYGNKGIFYIESFSVKIHALLYNMQN